MTASLITQTQAESELHRAAFAVVQLLEGDYDTYHPDGSPLVYVQALRQRIDEFQEAARAFA